MKRMNNEQVLAQALVDLEMELDLHVSDSEEPFLDKLWDIIHNPEVWNIVSTIMHGDQI